MKSLSKIFVHYLVTAIIIILFTLLLNLLLFVFSSYLLFHHKNYPSHIKSIVNSIQMENQNYKLTEEAYELLEKNYVWAMLLSDSGDILWDWQLPQELDHSYTTRELASFSKWYLKDYPVIEWVTDYGLFVAGKEKNSIWKYNISEPMDRLMTYPSLFFNMFMGNIIFIFLISLLLGFFFQRSLRGVAAGIEQLSEQKAIHLPEKGMTEILAAQLNRTSAILEEQKELLKKKDDARTTWISSVSHDIRTPLSLIMGYAGTLKTEENLTEKQKLQVNMIEAQSLQIKQLIEDLNLTSKLEYEMQPLRLSKIQPSVLLRKIVADFYNQDLPEQYEIELYIDPEVEQKMMQGDENLLARAFRNLIQNSIRHNPEGCAITITVYPNEEQFCFQVSDNGCGIPDEVIAFLEGKITKEKPHIMGLQIVKQIFTAHGWQMLFPNPNTIWVIACCL